MIYLVAYTDDEGPYAVAFSARKLAEAFVASFSARQDNRGGMTIIETRIDSTDAMITGSDAPKGTANVQS